MNDLHVTLVQPDIIWKGIQENLSRYSEMLAGLNNSTDLILFPEMFQTGFCTEPEGVAETMNGDTIRWMKRTAELLNCAVAGSLIIRENRRFFNRLVYIDQFENLTWYDKRHLFRMTGEETKFTEGRQRLVVPLKGWQINFQICYDLRFPVWARNCNDYDILINTASWPANRNEVWETLLKARAIENQSYVIGVNRVGRDDNNLSYIGNSLVIDPKGMVIKEMPQSREGLISTSLSWNELAEYREKFPVWKDWDNFKIEI
jgi:omega-amidase